MLATNNSDVIPIVSSSFDPNQYHKANVVHIGNYTANKSQIDAASLKTIEFSTDCSLCEMLENNINNSFTTTDYMWGGAYAPKQTLYKNATIQQAAPAKTGGKLTLNSVKFLEKGYVQIYPDYTFGYPTAKNFNYNKDYVDFWGNYKSDFIYETRGGYTSPQSQLDVDAWSMNKITSPTGSEINISLNQSILKINIPNTTANQNIKVTSFTFSTSPSTHAPDINAAKVFSTGSSPQFNTGNIVGNTVASPNGNFQVDLNQALATGNNYFWLAYDVNPAAGNILSGKVVSYQLNNRLEPAPVIIGGGGRPVVSLVKPDCPEQCTDPARNWMQQTTYDFNGTVVQDAKTYMDKLGRATQSQVKNLTKSDILATQTVFDSFGRDVLQTLQAPISKTDFCYKDKFIADETGVNYASANFDGSTKTNAPDPVSVTSALGAYYSNNNSNEPLVASGEGYPYNRVEYHPDQLMRVKRASAPGATYKMGAGHEQRYFYMNSVGELLYMFGNYRSYILGSSQNPLSTGNKGEGLTASKQVTVDADGLETTSYTNQQGKVIATCNSGQTPDCVNPQHVSQPIKYYGQRFVDIHLPLAKVNTLDLLISDDAKAHGALFSRINYKIFDLDEGKELTPVTDYDLSPNTANTIAHVTFKNKYLSKSNFLRISFSYTSDFYSFYYGNFTGPYIPDLAIKYDLDYTNWQLNYYDNEGNW